MLLSLLYGTAADSLIVISPRATHLKGQTQRHTIVEQRHGNRRAPLTRQRASASAAQPERKEKQHFDSV